MVKPSFSSALLVLFALLTFSVSARSVPRQTSSTSTSSRNSTTSSTSSRNATTSSSSSKKDDPCATLCDRAATVLETACPNGQADKNPVPCGCINTFSTAQEKCSRCRLSYSDSEAELARDAAETKDTFTTFRSLCIKAGASIRNIDVDDIDLAKTLTASSAVTTVQIETPFSIFDESFPNFITAVCINPDTITAKQCIIGGINWIRCPNGDVAGLLVRVAAYLANLLLGIIIMFSPAESATAVWTQLLTVYSLLISGLIAIGSSSLSRFHSSLTIFLVMSPLSSTLVVYAILGFCGRKHRLDNILSGRREHLLPRLLVIAYAVLSLFIVIYNSAASTSHFSPNPCEGEDAYTSAAAVFANLLFVPYAGLVGVLLVINLFVQSGGASGIFVVYALLALAPFIIIMCTLIYTLIKQKVLLSREFRMQPNRWKIWVTWDVIGEQYPFFHFCGVFLVPMIYWVIFNELQTFGTPDNIFAVSFGQILALFVILPPLWQVIHMAPGAWKWFLNLSIICAMTGRPRAAPGITRIDTLEEGMVPEKPASEPVRF